MLIDYIFPKSCIFCSKIGDSYLCNDCLKEIPFALPNCYYCKKINNNYLSHVKCNGYYKKVYSGWYMDNRRYKRILNSEEYIYIDIISKLYFILIKKFSLQNYEIISENKKLEKHINSLIANKKNKICLLDRSCINSNLTDIGISILTPQRNLYS